MPSPQPARARAHVPSGFALALLALALLIAFGAAQAIQAATPVTAGYRDQLYGDPNAPGGDDVTAGRNQNKLWFHDGRWWAVMFDIGVIEAKFRIYKFDMATQDWTTTGVAIDERNRSHADALRDGNLLYVASAHGSQELRIYKYTYNTTTKVYALNAGFPKTIPGTTAGTGYSSIAKDTAGVLWVSYPQAGRIKVAHSSDAGVTWSTADIPGQVNDVAADDVAAIAPLSGSGVNGIGVLWGNQSTTDDAFYYQVHIDGAAPGTWRPVETAFGGPDSYSADNHISLRTAPDGRAIAAVKTGRNDKPGPNPDDPLVAVLRRTGAPDVAGSWSIHTVTSVTLRGTRPVLVIDGTTNEANVFLTHPTLASQGAQAIYRRTAPLSTLDFGAASIGTAAIKSTTEVEINDATSMRSNATAQSGMLIAATNIPTRRYMHACIGGPCPVKPVANFTQNKTSGQAPLAVTFTDTSTNSPTSWAWDFDNNGTTDSTAKNPTHTYLVSGTYSVKLTVSNVAGSHSVTKTNLITVSPPPTPVANFTQNKTSGAAPLAVTFTDTSTNGPTSWAWDFDNNGTTDSTAKNPTHSYTKAGTYSVKLTISNESGGDSITKTNLITVTETAFYPVDPVRLLDTRTGNGLSGAFVANTARTWQISGRGGIPADAIAVTGNLTVTNQTKAGYISIGPTAATLGTTSSLNFPVGDVRANGVTLPLSASGKLSAVYKAGTGATAHIVFDVTGYFRSTLSGGTTFNVVDPVRLLDTRSGNGLSGAFVSSTPRTWQITGRGGIPAGATAITGNLTVVNQTREGYVSLGPVAIATPTTSTLNFPRGDIRANGVTVKLSASGTLSAVYKSAPGATTHLVLDVTGYFTSSAAGARFFPLEPARVLDTRIGNGLSGVFVSSTPRTWTVGGRGGVSASALAVIGNVTVVNQTRAGYVSVTPVAMATPTTSTINFPVGDIRANGITVKLGSGGKLSAVYKSGTGATTHLVFDVFGYYK